MIHRVGRAVLLSFASFWISILMSGCGNTRSLMPLSINRKAVYRVHYGLISFDEPLVVSKEVAVAGQSGFELSGPMGVSRVAWRNQVLYADQAVNAWFQPSLPILTEGPTAKPWHGRIVSMGITHPASATLEMAEEKIKFGDKEHTTKRATLKVKMDTARIELVTWYEAGVGMVRQDQTTKEHGVDHEVVRIELLTPP